MLATNPFKAVNMAVSLDSLQTKLRTMNGQGAQQETVTVSVSELKQKLGVGSGVRLVIEPDSTIPVLEDSREVQEVQQAVSPAKQRLAVQAAVDQPSPPPPPPANGGGGSNNVFMKRNVRVKEWGQHFSQSGEEGGREEGGKEEGGGVVSEGRVGEEERRRGEKERAAHGEIQAKEAAAVDSLMKKLQ